ncbi:MAG: thioredoxin [Pirellulaceae bacterium]|nr:thioredoxin [Pirellulaceae bacterium]
MKKITVVGCLMAGLLVCGCTSETVTSTPAPTVEPVVGPMDAPDADAPAEPASGDEMASDAVAATGGPLKVTDQDFEEKVLRSSTPVMVDFWAEWCPPCRMLAPTVDALATEYQGRVVVAKLDTDANPETPEKYEITGIPTMLFFKDGQLVERLVGNQPKDAIVKVLDSMLGS